MAPPKKRLGDAVEESMNEARNEWLRQHLNGRSTEEALAAGVKSIHATVERKPGGFLHIRPTIVSCKAGELHQDYFIYEYKDSRGYVRMGDNG